MFRVRIFQPIQLDHNYNYAIEVCHGGMILTYYGIAKEFNMETQELVQYMEKNYCAAFKNKHGICIYFNNKAEVEAAYDWLISRFMILNLMGGNRK